MDTSGSVTAAQLDVELYHETCYCCVGLQIHRSAVQSCMLLDTQRNLSVTATANYKLSLQVHETLSMNQYDDMLAYHHNYVLWTCWHTTIVMLQTDEPQCSHCDCTLTVTHVFLECSHYNTVRQRYFNISTLKELFNMVNDHDIHGVPLSSRSGTSVPRRPSHHIL